MTNENRTASGNLRAEIAAAAARMIVREGLTYEAAKKKALRQILGSGRINGNFLPDNDEIEQEIRTYSTLFMGDAQRSRLLHLRRMALQMMQELAQFRPYVTGAVLNGTVGEYSDIHLLLFAESPKDAEIFLLNKNIDISVTEAPAHRGKIRAAETIHFRCKGEIFHLAIYAPDDMRKMVRAVDVQAEKADATALEKLIEQQIRECS